jgi:hypothetical protein
LRRDTAVQVLGTKVAGREHGREGPRRGHREGCCEGDQAVRTSAKTAISNWNRSEEPPQSAACIPSQYWSVRRERIRPMSARIRPHIKTEGFHRCEQDPNLESEAATAGTRILVVCWRRRVHGGGRSLRNP